MVTVRPEDVPEELLRIVDAAAGKTHSRDGTVAQTLAAVLTRWEELRPYVCPFDCDRCHDDDDCPCDRLGCAGYRG